MPAIRQEIGARIRQGLTLRNLSEKDLADCTGLTLDCVSAYTEGRREIDFPELRAICRGLDVPIMRLLTDCHPFSVREVDAETLAEIEALSE